ncbi:metallophosphoesterase [Acidicapsa dinghuensis]|uniref:Metallophosphoesterase n=1 Tax=Acidicapsa dinghuensis TaxID=2218256 RepID=A0ABW1EE39_9BACT|nr:metallophosphoesterase [Acidicapsa dinghuensis]
MTLSRATRGTSLSRRNFLVGAAACIVAPGFYAGEIERHWTEITHTDALVPNLPPGFEGVRIAQLSDIHLDEFTEPYYLRDVVHAVNKLAPDFVFLTGDFVSDGPLPRRIARHAAPHCAAILSELTCANVYACLGNHDFLTDPKLVGDALTSARIHVLRNSHLPIERNGSRIWLAGLDDPLCAMPDPDAAIPASIRQIPSEPVLLLCHGPDYADILLRHPAGKSVSLMFSGHTHGGQVRLPFLGPVHLPRMGQKYVEGWFHLGNLNLYVNRGIGTVELPFRFNCPPEVTLFTLKKA